MDAIALVVVVLVIFALVFSTGSGKTYRCKKCGYTTNDQLQAVGHQTLENKHTADEV